MDTRDMRQSWSNQDCISHNMNIFTSERKKLFIRELFKSSFYWLVLNVQCSTTVVIRNHKSPRYHFHRKCSQSIVDQFLLFVVQCRSDRSQTTL